MKENLSEQLYKHENYPAAIHVFRFVYKWMRQAFEKITESRYNPVSNAGTLSVLFFSIVIISGFFLIFFYKLSAPYESIVTIQNNVFFLRWMRAIHRYASDAAVVAIILHMFKMLAQSRSWGPRLISWVTGVMLTGLLFFSAYTGYVLVWDEHAKVVGMTGLKIMNIIPVMPESLLRTFSGEKMPGDSFFFFVIFLHLAVPLFMIFGIWLHTSRISMPRYFFNRKTALFYTMLFIAVAMIIPAPLLHKADLFSLSIHFPVDAFFSFFLYFPDSIKSSGLLYLLIGFNVLLIGIPWYFKPSIKIPKEEYVSQVNIDLCLGCKQCYYDCPFDAIDMTESEIMKKKEKSGKAESSMIPVINPNNCVSCGLCAASCSTFAIGPKNRTGKDLLNQIREIENIARKKGKTAINENFIFVCSHNDKISLPFQAENADIYNVTCVGDIHSTHLHHVARHYKNIIILSCQESDCSFRQGPAWISERINGHRIPHLIDKQDREKISLVTDLSQFPGMASEKSPLNSRGLRQHFFSYRITFNLFIRRLAEIVTGLSVVVAIAMISRLPLHANSETSMLKLSWKIQGAYTEKCHEYSSEELQRIPKHMRKDNSCAVSYLPYYLHIEIDGVNRMKVYTPGGYRKDRPMLVYEEINISPGRHHVKIKFIPFTAKSKSSDNAAYAYSDSLDFKINEIILITMENGMLTQKAAK